MLQRCDRLRGLPILVSLSNLESARPTKCRSDRDGRMMSHYFDLSTLEANRKEAEVMKKKHKKYDWRKYKEMKKKEKTKRKVQQLLMD